MFYLLSPTSVRTLRAYNDVVRAYEFLITSQEVVVLY